MILTNDQIYNYALNLEQTIFEEEQKLPIKINFYLQKNKNTLFELAKDIEMARTSIAQSYGEISEETSYYKILPENVEVATKELQDLLMLEQEVNIYQVNIEDFPVNLNLTTDQMEALMFMIKE